MTAGKIAVVMSGFPRVSETFALGELNALKRRGKLAAIFAAKSGDGQTTQPAFEGLSPYVEYLPDLSIDLQSDFLVEKLRSQKISGIHGYFAHRPAEIAQTAAARLGLKFGFSTHAKDARKISSFELGKRAKGAACVIACNRDVAEALSGYRIHCLPHGVDAEAFSPVPETTEEQLKILAVGRLVEKKGFDVLIRAASRLRFPFHIRIVGDGPERNSLANLAHELGLGGKITFAATQTHNDLPSEYGNSNVVVVPSVVDRSGDRDGLPNVVLEAMASARAIVATNAGAIETAVFNEKNGLVVEQNDPEALAAAMLRLSSSVSLRRSFGDAARETVLRKFELTKCSDRFCDVLEEAYA